MKNKLILLGSFVSAAASVVLLAEDIRKHRDNMARIRAESKRDRQVIIEVRDEMLRRIDNGEYQGESLAAILKAVRTDFDFEIITRHFED